MTVDHRELWDRFNGVINSPSWDDDALDRLVTEDYVEEWPQSGEVIRGRANFLKMLRSYPDALAEGALDRESTRLAVRDEHWAVSPFFTLVRLESSGDVGTVISRTRYPDGSWWWVVGTYELRGSLVARRTTFFAPEYEAPAWRAGITERTKGS